MSFSELLSNFLLSSIQTFPHLHGSECVLRTLCNSRIALADEPHGAAELDVGSSEVRATIGAT